jgi:hypothetical protein
MALHRLRPVLQNLGYSVQSFFIESNHFCGDREPILRLRNLQLRRQRCSRLDRFLKVEESIFVFETY